MDKGTQQSVSVGRLGQALFQLILQSWPSASFLSWVVNTCPSSTPYQPTATAFSPFPSLVCCSVCAISVTSLGLSLLPVFLFRDHSSCILQTTVGLPHPGNTVCLREMRKVPLARCALSSPTPAPPPTPGSSAQGNNQRLAPSRSSAEDPELLKLAVSALTFNI